MEIPGRVAIIPARCGSKRIPWKNLLEIDGKPVLLHAIELAYECEVFNHVYVSTDCDKITETTKEAGYEVLPRRPKELSDDNSKTIDVIKYEINQLSQSGKNFKEICCIYPVTPLLKKSRIIEGLRILQESERQFVIPIQAIENNRYRNIEIDSINGEITKVNFSEIRTQDFETRFMDAGQFYWGTKHSWIESTNILITGAKTILLDRWETIDVDNPEDFEVLRAIYEYRKRRGN